MVRLLFELGKGVLEGNSTGSSPLSVAASSEYGQDEIIDFLLDSGANVDGIPCERFNDTPLCKAARFGKLKAARKLIERGASVNGIIAAFGTTPLTSAVLSTSCTVSMIDLLIANGADVNMCRPKHQSSIKRCTALTEACLGFSGVEIIERLLHHGVNVNLGSPPPLENALESKQSVDVTRLLLKAGANVGLVSKNCIETLRSIAGGALDLDTIREPWYRCKEPSKKLEVLEEYMSRTSGKSMKESSGNR